MTILILVPTSVLTVSQATVGYTGSDIRLVCKEAAMRPIRKIFDALENHTEGKNGTFYFIFLHKICTNIP